MIMLAKTGTPSVLANKDFIFEPKLDGFRALCIVDKKGKAKFLSRNNLDLTEDFPELKFRLPEDSIFDGEIVVYNEKGNPDFSLMLSKGCSATYVLFDIIKLQGKDIAGLPLAERKKILKKAVKETGSLQLMVFTDNGKKLFAAMKKIGLEGIVAKKKSSKYVSGRSSDWLKIKLFRTIDCAIVGYLSKKKTVSSLAAALHDGSKFVYVGQVGIGISESASKELAGMLKKIKMVSSAVDLPRTVQPVEIVHVCEVKYVEMTRDMMLRSGVFLRMRPDKNPVECRMRQS